MDADEGAQMQKVIGWGLALLGLLCVVLGVVVMVVLGPDSRFTSGPHAIDTDGVAMVTAPRVISWADVQVDVLAEVPVQKPVFVGLGNSVDVENYVARTARLEVTRYRTPWELQTRDVDGEPNLPGAPTALDWWLADSAGLGGAGISTTLPDETVSLAVLAVGASNLSGLELTVAYGIKGGFYQGLGLALLGAGGVGVGLGLRRDALWTDVEDDDLELDEEYEEIEEVVYVYVDDDGVEHEISAEEAAAYEVEGEVVVEEPEPGPEPEPEAERVVYVYVDDDGVEHEVGADELAEFEVVDDEEDDQR